MSYDGAALPLLVEVMAAAGHHDADRCRDLLDQAEAQLGRGRHKARPDVTQARDAVDAGEWITVWARAYQAIAGLTWGFPPALSVCPPAPQAAPYPVEGRTCGCGQTASGTAAFCPSCGTALADPTS